MSYCPNCKARLTCGCQKRVSNKGVAGCSKCIGQLNAAPLTRTATSGANKPTKTKAYYKGPGTQN